MKALLTAIGAAVMAAAVTTSAHALPAQTQDAAVKPETAIESVYYGYRYRHRPYYYAPRVYIAPPVYYYHPRAHYGYRHYGYRRW